MRQLVAVSDPPALYSSIHSGKPSVGQAESSVTLSWPADKVVVAMGVDEGLGDAPGEAGDGVGVGVIVGVGEGVVAGEVLGVGLGVVDELGLGLGLGLGVIPAATRRYCSFA